MEIRKKVMNFNTCKKKTSKGNVYNTLNIAKQVAKEMELRCWPTRMDGFPCKYCNKFHIGGRTGRLKDKEQKVWHF